MPSSPVKGRASEASAQFGPFRRTVSETGAEAVADAAPPVQAPPRQYVPAETGGVLLCVGAWLFGGGLGGMARRPWGWRKSMHEAHWLEGCVCCQNYGQGSCVWLLPTPVLFGSCWTHLGHAAETGLLHPGILGLLSSTAWIWVWDDECR